MSTPGVGQSLAIIPRVDVEQHTALSVFRSADSREPDGVARLDSDQRSTPLRSRRTDQTLPPSVLLRDGRRLHRFYAAAIPETATPETERLMDNARCRKVVLVADGLTLGVVEPWLSTVSPETLQELRENAGAVIAVLRGESRQRTGCGASGESDGEHYDDDPW